MPRKLLYLSINMSTPIVNCMLILFLTERLIIFYTLPGYIPIIHLRI